MEQLVTSEFKLGIIAGGQLAKMMVLAASNWDVKVDVMDKDIHCPAADCGSGFFQGDPLNYDDVYRFGKSVDLLTFELENVNLEAVRQLKKEGCRIAPDPEVLATIQDKGVQKQFYEQQGLPSAPFRLFENKKAILAALADATIRLPFVQKLRRGGYDGRGVQVVRSEGDLSGLMEGPSVVEAAVDIDKEISVIVARNASGEVMCFPSTVMDFNAEANLVERLICPSGIEEATEQKAAQIARKLAESLSLTGLLAVEFFIDRQGELWINESAPRPHNSGHHTIESVITSQYEQMLRAIFNFPLGDTSLKIPSVMINLLGAPGHEGPVRYAGLTDCLALPGVKIHLYGKKHTRPFRKMGHATILCRDKEKALQLAAAVKEKLKVVSWNQQ